MFPKQFLWGATTSAHSVEGSDFDSDWWRWEQRPGRVVGQATSKVAADHFARFEDDFRLACKLGHKAHLFSLSWSRIEPEEGSFDGAALSHYAAVFEALATNGMEPVCVLQHISLPEWFAAQGGWVRRDSPTAFVRYAGTVAENLGGMCRIWIPIFEPMYFVDTAFLHGCRPPEERNPMKAFRVLRHLMEAHARCYDLLHARQPDSIVGIGIRGRRFQPEDPNSPWDFRAARRESARYAHWIPRAVTKGRFFRGLAPRDAWMNRADFVGLSYYGQETVRFSAMASRRLCIRPTGPRARPRPDPHGFRDLLIEMASHQLPLLVTGNGLATDDDVRRAHFLLDHVSVLNQAREDGLDIRGYFHRSLLDGFEWGEGYRPRYGLIHVDRATLGRTPNGSAYLFKDICETGWPHAGTLRRLCPTWTNNLDDTCNSAGTAHE